MHHMLEPSTFTNGDDRLVSAIRVAFRECGFWPIEDFGISVQNDIVTLIGKTDTFYQRQILVNAAHRVPGVLGLVDAVVVKSR